MVSRGPLLACLLAAIAAVAWNVWAGPEWSWDRLQYHQFAGFRLTHDVAGLGFAPAGGQSFLNPLAHLPGWLLAAGGLDEFALSCVLAVLHAGCVALVWDATRRLFVALPATRVDAAGLAVLSAVLAFLTPVYLLEVGTSYADVTTTLPLLAGVSLALRGRAGAAGWTLAAGVAMGLAAGLKLSNALAALCGTLLVLQAGLGPVLARVAAYGAGGLIGVALGHGPWGLRLWRDTGNPVFPMFDGWFAPAAAQAGVPVAAGQDTAGDALSPVAQAVAAGPIERLAAAWDHLTALLRMSGARFTPRDAHDWLTFPWRVADPELPPSAAYIETFQPDPRLLLLAALGACLAVAALVRRVRGAGRPGATTPSDDGRVLPDALADRRDRRGVATMRAFVAFWLAWYALWAHSSSNGRYAIGLLMLAAPLSVAAVVVLVRSRRARAYGLLALLVVQATWALVIADPRGHLARADWSDADLRVSVPPELGRAPVLHLTGWATSWSFLAPALPPGSAFANLDQARARGVRGLDPETARGVIARWQGPVRVLDPVTTLRGDRPEMPDGQRESIDAWLAAMDLAVDPQDCVAIGLNVLPGRPKMSVETPAGGRSTRDADRVLSCAVRPAPGAAQAALERARRHDDLFAAVERRCAAQLGAPRDGTRWLGGKSWQRDYPTRGLRLQIAAGQLRVSDELGRGMLVGPVDLLRVGVDQIDCATLVPSRERDRRNVFGTDRGEIDFGGPAPSAPSR